MGRKPKLTPHQIKEARQRLAKGERTRDPRQELRRKRQHDFAPRRLDFVSTPAKQPRGR